MSEDTAPRILVVDDEKDNLEALKRLFRKHFDVSTALSGEEALELVANSPSFDALISDQRMPGLSGAEFFAKAQEIDSFPTRILLTGFADLEAIIEAVNRGHIWRYVAKPWESDDLLLTAQQAVERTRLRRSLEESRASLERALNELKAKDWARERLLQILLHEFRTAPQILESLKELRSPSDEPTHTQFIDRLVKRYAVIEEDISSLLDDEKRISSLEKKKLALAPFFESIAAELDIFFLDKTNSLCPPAFVPQEIFKENFRVIAAALLNNSRKAPLTLTLEEAANTAFMSLVVSSTEGLLLPANLQKSGLEASQAWLALFEPFVGAENFEHHSTGLRLGTARAVRQLEACGAKVEIQVSGQGSKVEFLAALKLN